MRWPRSVSTHLSGQVSQTTGTQTADRPKKSEVVVVVEVGEYSHETTARSYTPPRVDRDSPLYTQVSLSTCMVPEIIPLLNKLYGGIVLATGHSRQYRRRVRNLLARELVLRKVVGVRNNRQPMVSSNT